MTDHQHSHHDLGGQPAGTIDRGENETAFWEKRVDAILMLLTHKDRQIMQVDELRRGIESLGPDVYDRLSYYERWIASITAILIEKGVLTQEEVDKRIAQLRNQRESND